MASMVEGKTDAPSHFPEIRDVESRAQQFETPCGAGSLVWHKWGEGPPLLMLHGGSGSWFHWLRQIPVLESRYFTQ